MRATFFVLTAAAFGVGIVAVACSSEPAPNPYKLPDGPIPTSTGEPADVGTPRDAGVDADAIADANAPDTATPPGWCAYHPPATAPDPVRREWYQDVPKKCDPGECDGVEGIVVLTNLDAGEDASAIRPSRSEGCASSYRPGQVRSCCPKGCFPAGLGGGGLCQPNETRYHCSAEADGGAYQLHPSTNCRSLGIRPGPIGTTFEHWCCDDSKPY